MKIGLRTLLLLFCTHIGSQLLGQNMQLGQPPIHNYTKQEYGAETQNWSIEQDQRGLMYFGNNLGLLEFDGTNWECFPLPNRSIARAIASHPEGQILVGGQDELGYFEVDGHEKMVYHSLVDLLPETHRTFEDVWKIFPTEAGIFWGTHSAMFWQRPGSVTTDFELIPATTRFDNFFYCQGKILVAEFQRGISIWEGDSLSLIPGGEFFADLQVSAILAHPFQGWLVITKEAGIFHYQFGDITPWASQILDFASENQIYCGLALKSGQIAIGTSQNGLLILDKTGQAVRQINTNSGLLNNSILSIQEGRSGNLWLGLESGISYLEIRSPFSWINATLGVSGAAYASLIMQDTLYLATNQGIYFQPLSPTLSAGRSGQFQLVRGTKSPAWGLNNIRGKLLASQHQGASLLSAGKAYRMSAFDGAWKHLHLHQFPHLALEGTYAGLLLYQWSASQEKWVFLKKLEGFDESSRVMEQDEEGNIWISHAYRGVYRIRLSKTGEEIEEVSFYRSEDGFPSDFSINVCNIRGEVLFTTEEGLYQFDPEQDRFFPHEAYNALLDLPYPLHRLIEDQLGNIWYSAGEEFGRLRISDNPKEDRITKFPLNRFQKHLVKGFEHIYSYDESHIFIGTEAGFILFNPQEVQQQLALPIYIREVTVMGHPDSTISWGAIQMEENAPSLPPTFQDFHFSFSAAYYGNVNEVQYQYFLEGLDENWSEWNQKTEKEYTNLMPGSYQFRVRARNIYGTISQVTGFSFVIQPPWYATTWARAIYAILILLSLLSFYYLNAFRLKKKTDALRFEQARTLQKKEAEFQEEVQKSEAQIIRLHTEKLESEVQHKNKELASAAMHLVQKGEILLKIKQSLSKLGPETSSPGQKQIQQLIRTIDDDIKLDKNWKQFEYHFDQVHGHFLHQLRTTYPQLTAKDQRMCAYLKMNLTTKEIAQLMNISVRGVEISRYRLRKKLDLPREQNLNEFMMSF